MNDHEYILTLLQKEALSDSEIEFLAARNTQDPSDPLWETAAEQFVIRMKQQNGQAPSEAAKLALKKILEQLGITEQPITPVHRVHFLKTAWFKYAAAIIILITGIAIYFFTHTSQPETVVVQNVPPASGSKIAPGFNRAVLTLSNGQKVELDSAASETINDGTLSIKNINGQLSYTSGGSISPAGGGGAGGAGGGSREARTATYNTMTTPRGGQYQLTLSDGTKVWLNAASTITYPTAFTQKTREVTITGEAYFEVAKNPKQPFIVKTSKEDITVLGTAFNVNSYENESSSKTSLIEGSVKVSPTSAESTSPISPAGGSGRKAAEGGSREARTATGLILKPGQAYQNGKITTTSIEQDLAWKNGIFNFSNQDFATSMRQLERWYDIKVIYDGAIPTGKFRGEISRNLNLSDAIELLNGVVARFKLQGRELHVLK